MASVKNIVKVMNFHALIRVEKARHVAEGYFSIEHELTPVSYTHLTLPTTPYV